MQTPAMIFLIAGLALILWGMTSAPAGHSSFVESLTGTGTPTK